MAKTILHFQVDFFHISFCPVRFEIKNHWDLNRHLTLHILTSDLEEPMPITALYCNTSCVVFKRGEQNKKDF